MRFGPDRSRPARRPGAARVLVARILAGALVLAAFSASLPAAAQVDQQVTGVAVRPSVRHLEVSWDRPAMSLSLGELTGYKVQWKSGDQSFGASREMPVEGAATTSVSLRLAVGVAHTVRVIATNADGDGQPSAESAAGTPLAPQQLAPLGDVFWDADLKVGRYEAQDYVSYGHIWRNSSGDGTVDPDEFTIGDLGVTYGFSVYYHEDTLLFSTFNYGPFLVLDVDERRYRLGHWRLAIDPGNELGDNVGYYRPRGPLQAFCDCEGYFVNNHGLDWIEGERVKVRLSLLRPPEAPDVTATSGETEVLLRWNEPDSDLPIEKYEYRVSVDDRRTWDPDWTDVPDNDGDSDLADERAHTVTGLVNGTEYVFEMRAQSGPPYAPVTRVRASPTVREDATLASLAVSGSDGPFDLNPDPFDPATFGYSVAVPWAVSRVTIAAPSRHTDAVVAWLDANGDPITDADAAAEHFQMDPPVGTTVVSIRVTAPDGTARKTYTLTLVRAEVSRDAALATLEVTHGGNAIALDPAPFGPDVLSYDVTVPNAVRAVTVAPTTRSDLASHVFLDGSDDALTADGAGGLQVPLAVGDRTVKVKVTAEDGATVRIYTLRFARDASSDATLEAWTLLDGGGAAVALASSTALAHVARVDAAVSVVTVSAAASDPEASLAWLDGMGEPLADADPNTAGRQVNLDVGETAIQVRISATDGTTVLTHRLTVTRAAVSDDASLARLRLRTGDVGGALVSLAPAFDAATQDYAAWVAHSVSRVTVEALPGDDAASVSWLDGNDNPLADADLSANHFQANIATGDNVIKVKVTAADGVATRTWTLTVTRRAMDPPQSSGGPVLVANDGQTASANTIAVGVLPAVGGKPAVTRSWAQPFMTGSNSGGYTLESLVIRIRGAGEGTVPRVRVFTDRNGLPHAEEHILRNPSALNATDALTATTLTAPADAMLDARTSYWLVFEAAAGVFSVGRTASDAEDAGRAPGWSIGDNILRRSANTTAWSAATSSAETIRISLRGEPVSADARLRELAVSRSGGTVGLTPPDFDPDLLRYAAVVAHDVASVSVVPTLNDDGASVAWFDANGATLGDADARTPVFDVALPEGPNTVKIRVTAADGTTVRTYILVVTRLAAPMVAALVSNVGQNVDSIKLGVGAVSTGRQHVRAQMFETGSNDGGYRLEALDIYLLDFDTADGARIAIHENTNRVVGQNRQDFPGASLHSLTTPTTESSVANTAEKFTFPAPSNAMLEPDTKYWIVVEATGGASAVLRISATASDGEDGPRPPGWNIGNGSRWKQLASDTWGTNGVQARKMRIAVRGTSLPSSDATLKSLDVMHGAGPVALVPSTFNADTLAYAASVGHAVTTVTVVPETGAGGAVVTYLDGAGAVLADADGEAEHFQLALSEGENTVQVKVTATVPTSMRTYVLTVTRRALSIDATLESLALANASDAVLDLAPPFNPGVTGYEASVGYEVEQVTVAAGMGYPDATVQFLDGTDAALADANAAPGFQAALAVGANTVKVKVTAEDGKATETYVLTVTRATAGTLPLTVEEGIAGDDVVNAVEKAAGFVIAGTTGTVAGASVTVRVGTEDLTSVSGADGAWSVSVPAVAVYIDEPGVEVTVSAMQGDYTDAEAVTRTLGVDLTAPQVVSSTVHGTSLAMVYTEPLDTSSVPEADAFVVEVDGSEVALAEAGAVTFDGASLTLTLAAAVNTGQAVTVTYTTPTGQDATPLRDAAGNEVVSDTVERMVDVRDSTAPTVASIARRSPTSSPTNADELIWRVTFSEAVENVDGADFEVSGANATLTAGAVSGSPLIYDVTAVEGNLAGLSGTVTLSFASGQDIADTDGNVLENTEPTDANDASYVLDNTAPTVEISGVPDTSTGAFTAVIAFSEVVNGFAVEDIAVVNGSAAALTGTDGGKKFTALITPTGDGTVTVDVAAGVAEDTAGNGNLVAARASSAYIAPLTDNNAPTVVSITRQTPLSSPTNANTLTWRVIFSEDVVNVDGADFRVSGTTATLMAGAVSGSSLAYDVTAAGSGLASVDATVTLSFAAEQNITDRDGDALSNTAPTGANDVTFVVDNNAPGVTSVARQTPSSSPTNADRLTWRVTFSEAVANVDGADFRVTGTTAALTVAPVVSETGAYDVTAAADNLASVDATVTLSFAAVQNIADTVGNALASTVPTKVSEASYVVDNTAPGVRSITRQTPTESPTNADELTWRVTFSEAVANVDAADFRVAGTTAALTVAPVVSETGAYDVTAAADNLASVDATVTLSFAAVQNIADTVGNALASTVPTKVSEASYVVDNTAPGVEITRVPAESEAAFTAMITFLEGVTGFAVEDITVGNGTASNFTGADGGTVFSVLITPTEDGEVTVEVAAEVATDAAGNGNTAAAQVSSTYTGFDPTAGICGRTEAVRDAIVAGIDGISDCADVTPTHLEAINVLILRNARVTTLAAGDFAGLTALITLDLSGNRLTALPAGVFDGLTSLTTLRLYSNRLATLRSDVFAGLTNLSILNLDFNDLQTLPAGVFGGLKRLSILKLNDNPGAPFAPSAVAAPDDGTVPAAGGAVTLDGSGGGGPWGGNVTYSWALTTPSSGVTVSFDDRRRGTPKVTIPAVAAGTELTFTLTVTGRGGANPFSNGFDTSQDTATVTVSQPGICTRTAAVQTAILGKIEGVDDCADVTATHLAAITGSLSLSRRSISSIAAGDFAGLTALTALYLHRNRVGELPVGVFDDLTSLTTLNLLGNNLSTIPVRTFARLTSLTHLYLSGNSLSTLPAGVFDGLTALTNLTLYGNSLTALPARVFDGLTALNSLDLWGNSLGTLPAGVFDDLTSLTTLLLYSNKLRTLPAGVFEPLKRLTELRLELNPGDPSSR